MVACGVGELVSSLIVGKLRISKTLKLSFFGELLLALALLMLAINYAGVVSSFIVALIACVLIGISATIIDIPLITAIQSDVDDSKSGKIFSYWSALGALGGSVGTLIVSGLISWLGLESTIMIMMVWLIISCLAAYLIAYGVKRSGR
jgi:predicted MFS family arabinose efflux permease